MIRRAVPLDTTAFDDAWASGDSASLDADTAQLVRTAQLIAQSAAVEPRPEFRDRLRDRLLAEASDVLVAQPALTLAETTPSAPHPQPVRRRLAGLTAAAVAAIGTVGMVSSSASAVPGDVLYPIKQGVESVQLALHRDDASRGEFQLDQARERLAEAQWLDSHDQDARVADALDSFSDQAAAGSSQLFTVYDSDRSDEAIDTVNDFAAEATVMLATMSSDLPADAQAALGLATDTITGLASRASLLCAACAPADLSSLVAAVEAAADDAPPSATTQPSVPATDTASEPAPTTNDAPNPKPSTAASTNPPAPTPTAVPSLKDITDPLIGDLLGDEGLVSGLLDGLLGNQN